MTAGHWPLGVVTLAVLAAAVTDIHCRTVHNALTLPLLAVGLLYNAVQFGGAGLLAGTQGALVGFAIMIGFYALGGMGAGDVKLMAAIGAWFGVPATCAVAILGGLAGGVYALVLILLPADEERRRPDETRLEQQVRRGRTVPFAAMIALAVATLVAANVVRRAAS
jgi:prepilin peptidase CpaA